MLAFFTGLPVVPLLMVAMLIGLHATVPGTPPRYQRRSARVATGLLIASAVLAGTCTVSLAP